MPSMDSCRPEFDNTICTTTVDLEHLATISQSPPCRPASHVYNGMAFEQPMGDQHSQPITTKCLCKQTTHRTIHKQLPAGTNQKLFPSANHRVRCKSGGLFSIYSDCTTSSVRRNKGGRRCQCVFKVWLFEHQHASGASQ
ncbi:hypothetical protein LSTR_LSTR014291 [Laodelphax striatellus]|uniref:Uncharacterized protein n=1 Tax=Laodelphax striatellus TaxID=195883 RepID=A0A482WJS9_LAOST|nr:hypothetical protein LSTR_LSTR014291 [Laodelphax striatellus]